ncbi:MAG: hypothetical protein ABI162_18690, partial [Luteolibacter sp.]
QDSPENKDSAQRTVRTTFRLAKPSFTIRWQARRSGNPTEIRLAKLGGSRASYHWADNQLRQKKIQMKVQSVFLIFLGTILHSVAAERASWLSPDKQFVATCLSRNSDGTGSRLVLSTAGPPDGGIMVRENDRWIRASWSPDSKFLEVTDGSDGHVTDIFVYRVIRSEMRDTKVERITFPAFGDIVKSANASGIHAELWYHTPDIWTYDVRWEFVGWAGDNVSMRLLKHTPGAKDKRVTATFKSPIESTTTNPE